jgi:hypothetical protein
MTADGVAHAVRGQVGLGRLLPLGTAGDAVWIAEYAAAAVLRTAERAVPRARLAAVDITLAEPAAHDWGAVRTANPAAPPSALPAGPLRIAADVLAPAELPIPRTAESLRTALLDVAADRLGLDVRIVDLSVVDLLDAGTAFAMVDVPPPPEPEPLYGPGQTTIADPARDAALTVPGVRTAASRPAPGDAIRLHITLDATHRALDVAQAVRTATNANAVVVTGIA